MGYERGGRDGDRGDGGSRQPRQDYDRSYGARHYGDQSDGGQSYGQGYRDTDRSRFGARDDRGGDGGREDYGRTTGAWRDRDVDRSRGYGRQPQGYDHDERGFFDHAGDEVRSWFGDEDAERRRRLDERHDEREQRSAGSTGYGGADRNRDRTHAADAQYRSWRDRQMEQFDRDYDDYRREHQSKFDTEFHDWRRPARRSATRSAASASIRRSSGRTARMSARSTRCAATRSC